METEMDRPTRRRFGRQCKSTGPLGMGASHVIKIGRDIRKKGDSHPKPGKLNGFFLCRDTIGEDGYNRLIDQEAMAAMGATPEGIAMALKMLFKAPRECLPTELYFVLTKNAVRTGKGWKYPGTFAEQFQCWNKGGLFCFGNGTVAERKKPDGSKALAWSCVPVGARGAEAKDFCPESAKGDCKARSRLVLCLFKAGSNNKPIPLIKALGFEARFRVDTSSEFYAPRVWSELDDASDRLEGNLIGITGTLTFLQQKKRYKDGVAPTGQILFTLCEEDIAARERILKGRVLHEKRMLMLGVEGIKEPPPAIEEEEPHNPFTVSFEEPAEETGLVDTAETLGGPELEPEPTQFLIPVAEATDEELMFALWDWAGDTPEFQKKVWFMWDDPTQEGQPPRQVPVSNVAWFRGGDTPEKAAFRIEKLHNICERAEAEKDSGFVVHQDRETADLEQDGES